MLDVKKQRLNVAREEVKFDFPTKNVVSNEIMFNMLYLLEILVYLHEFLK